jgi:16S rRNA processing protein RimM
MQNDVNWVVVGRFGRPHGLKGFIIVHSFTEPRENILQYKNWHILKNNVWQPVTCILTECGHHHILTQIEGFTDRDEVAKFTNLDIGVDVSQLKPLPQGEFYWHELQGMTVSNQEGREFGTVTEVFATGSNDVLVVDGEKRHLIPFLIDTFVLSVDAEKRHILVDWDWDF